jgi:hypothetical protein
MRRFLLALLIAAALPLGAASGQKKQSRCETAARIERNWEVIGQDYVFFDYVLCPPGIDPPQPLVRVWITTAGNGFGLEKWAPGADGADVVSVF